MRTIIQAVATLLAPMLVYGIVFDAAPRWVLWPSAIFMTALVVRGRMKRRTFVPFVPFGMLLGAALSVALVMPGVTAWLLWPVLVTTLTVVFVGVDQLAEDASRPSPR